MERKKIRLSFNAPVTLTFVILCSISLVLHYISNGQSTYNWFCTYHSSLGSITTYIRMLTHVLGHDGVEHFAGNMIYILLLGPMLEEKYSSRKLLLVIVVTAMATGMINYIFFPNVILCGASGICFSFMVLSSITGFRKGEIPITFIIVIVIFLGQQVLQGLFQSDNISNMSHIVGGVIGAYFGFRITKERNR